MFTKTSALVLALALVFALLPPEAPASAQEETPAVVGLKLPPELVMPGDSFGVLVDMTGGDEVLELTWQRPSGINDTLPDTGFGEPDGNTFATSVTLPSNTASGTWTVAEIAVEAGEQEYRFLNAAIFQGVTTCGDGFDDLGGGVLGCASDVVAESGSVEVGGDNSALAEPLLSEVLLDPTAVAPGGELTLHLEVTDVDLVEAVWVRHLGTGSVVELPVLLTSSTEGGVSGVLQVPGDIPAGEYRLHEAGVENAIAEPYRFLDAEAFDEASCPDGESGGFVNGGAAWICSTDLFAETTLAVIVVTAETPDPFQGSWHSLDFDNSNQTLSFSGEGDTREVVLFDDNATGACDSGGPATGTGTGHIDGNTISGVYDIVQCDDGTEPLTESPFQFVYDPTTDTLTDAFDLVWFRQMLYGVNASDDGLSLLAPATGESRFIGPLHPDADTFVTPVAMGVHPADGTLWVWNNSGPSGVLLTVDACTGLGEQVGEPTGRVLGALAFAPDGSLYGLSGALFSIDLATGATAPIGDGFGITIAGADFSADGVLYGVELLSPHRLVTIDPATGEVNEIAMLSGLDRVGSIVFDDRGNLIGSGFGTTGHILFDIPLDVAPDPDTGTLTVANVREITGGTAPQGMGFSVCVPADDTAPIVVDTLEVSVDDPETGPGATSVNLVDIPIEAVFEATAASTAASPLGAVPLGAVDLAESPLGAVPLGAVPLGAVPLGAVPLGAVPLGAVAVDFPGGWSALLQGTPFEGRPLQTILLSEVITHIDDGLAVDPLASLTIAQVSLDATPLGAVSLLSLALGALPLGAVPLGAVGETGCDAALDQGFDCDPGTTTLIELELAGFDVAASPLGAVPLGAVPLGAVPLGAVPLGAVPLGAVPLGAVPLGAVPLGAVPLGAVPAQSVPLGAVPLGAVPLGAVPLGAVTLEGTPLGAVPLSLIDGCDFLACDDLGLSGDSSLHEAAEAWEAANSTTLAASPLGAVPLGAIPLGAVPLGAIPLGAVPLGAVDLTGTPLGAVPLGAVGGCDLLTGFAHSCSTLGAGDDTTLYELALLLEAAGASLAASPLGAVTLDQLPLGAIDPLAVLGLDATLADIFCEAFDDDGNCLQFLADVEDWGSITLGQIIIAMLIVADFPWEELPFDRLGVQDFAATGDTTTYTVRIGASGGPGVVEVSVALPPFYRYRAGTAGLVGSPILDPVVDQNEHIQTLRFFVTLEEGLNDLSFDVASGLRLGTSTVDVTAGEVSALEAAAHTVIEPNEFGTLEPNIIYLGYITASDDIDVYEITPPGEGFRTSVFLGHLSEDVDLVMYRPTDAPTEVSGTPLGAVPFEDRGFGETTGSGTPETLADVPITDRDSVASVSTNRSNIPESTSVVEDGTGSGNYTVQVSGYNGATSDDPYVLRSRIRSEVPVPECSSRVTNGTGSTDLSALDAPGLESIFVVNGTRLDALHDPGSSAAVLDALDEMLAYLNDPANGFGRAAIVRIDGVNYSAWDDNPCDPNAANAIAEAIRGPIVAYAKDNPSLKYVTIVGSDEVIPFFRQPDDTAYANEDTYAGEFTDNALHGSLLTRHILTDDGYGDLDPIPWLDHALFLPELGVGRLVEEPADIVGQLDTFVAFDGALDRSTGFVSGYDFLSDGATQVAQNLAAGGATTTSLISEVWTSDDLIDGLLVPGAVPDLASPNAHYDHHRSLPADQQGIPEGALTADVLFDVGDVEDFVAANPEELSRTVIFTMGCHAGTSVADVSVSSTASTNPTDWAQVYGQEAATFVANTGYGYGDTVTVALSERLMAEFASRLDGSLSAGQAMVGAKQHYFGNLGLYGVYDEKAMQEIVFYGLPMYRVGAQGSAPTTPPPPGVVTDPGTGLGVTSVDLDPIFDQEDSERGTFFTIDGDTQGIHYRPIQPKLSTDVTVEGKTAKGALITDLVTDEVTVEDPAFFRPTIDLSANEAEIENFDVIFPTTFATIGTFQQPSTDPGERSETRQNLNLVAGQYVGATRTQRLFDEVGLEVLYVDDGTAEASDFTPPAFRSVQAAVVGGSAGFVVDLADNDDAVRVLVLYRDGSGQWQSAELQPGSPWTGGGPVAAGTTVVEYFVQAVDAAGNVGMTSFKGAFHQGAVVPTDLPDADPDVDLAGQLGDDGWFTSDVTVSATGDGPYSATLDGVPVPLPFTIGADGLHIVQISGGDPDPVTFAVKVDRTPPQVTIRSPGDGNTYLLDQDVPADFRCSDAGSGIVSCVGDEADGDPIDTTPVGPKTFTVTATDFAGHTASDSSAYQVVRDLDLAVEPALVTIDEAVTASSPLDGEFESAVIDWGDGTTCTIGQDSDCAVTGDEFSATHVYTAAGVHTVTLTVEYQGLTLTDVFEFVVVYDPSAGFVTGGGNYDSHPGAYRPDPTAEGVARFGFVSRYQKGRSVPSGNTAFEFSAGDLRFKSTSYEWLVISGATARYKGLGTINGEGEFGFILSAFDADINSNDSFHDDLFRIKIWDEATGETVYDTSCDAEGDCEEDLPDDVKKGAVPIRGSIVVHDGN